MKFEEALFAMRQGKKVKILDWEKPVMLRSISELVFCHDNEAKPYLSIENIINGHWEIVE